MNPSNFHPVLCLLMLLSACAAPQEEENTTTRPNIIYILADDLGYGDLSCNNEQSKIKTPNIDALASAGLLFTDAHSGSAVCTPTRYGVLTGRYAWRSRLKSGVTWSYDEHLIATNRTTVGDLLQKNGYHTACIGKWHLGLDWAKDAADKPDFTKPIKNGPNELGFDYFFGITASLDIPPYFYIENDRITATSIDSIEGRSGKEFWRPGPVGDDFKHIEVLPKLTEKAVEYINERSKQNQAFFLYFPLPAPHTPILPTEEFQGKSQTNEYGDFVLMVDDVVRRINQALEQNDLAENTLLIFTSDNGCSPMADFEELAAVDHDPSYVFRGHKADIFEGGHRVPFIARWPAKIPAGKQTNEISCLTDFIATCAAIVGDSIPADVAEDSYNLLPVLLGKSYESPIREATVHHSINGSFSIRQGNWKLNFCPGSGGWSDPRPVKARESKLSLLQLYDLSQDIGETQNVADSHPEVVSRLTDLMASYVEKGRSTEGEAQENDREVNFLAEDYE